MAPDGRRSMTRTVLPGPRNGQVSIPASKSRAHRLMICGALGDQPVFLRCEGVSRDIRATGECLAALGAGIQATGDGIRIRPVDRDRPPAEEWTVLPCGESGSTLRFLLPVAGALGIRACFLMEGRLPQRPMTLLTDLMQANGCRIRQEGDRLLCEGKLEPGAYAIPGNVSSQYISGLLFGLPLTGGKSRLCVTGETESADYIAMTEEAMAEFGWRFEKNGRQYLLEPHEAGWTGPAGTGACREIRVERDWSSAAFFLAMGAMAGEGIRLPGMNTASRQGDRRIMELLHRFGAETGETAEGVYARPGRELRGIEIDASHVPDLVPILAVVGAVSEGETRIVHAGRLRLKESDRLQTTAEMLTALGAQIRETEDGLIIGGQERLRGGKINAHNDHRIAMAAAAAAVRCAEGVTVEGSECTEKSFPGFWDRLEALGTDRPEKTETP